MQGVDWSPQPRKLRRGREGPWKRAIGWGGRSSHHGSGFDFLEDGPEVALVLADQGEIGVERLRVDPLRLGDLAGPAGEEDFEVLGRDLKPDAPADQRRLAAHRLLITRVGLAYGKPLGEPTYWSIWSTRNVPSRSG